MLDEDQSIHSEIIWTFIDVERELLKSYPNGQCISEELVTIDGAYTWRIDFYPNGKDLKTYGRVIVSVELVGALDAHSQVDAECSFSLKNRKRRKHYMGKMNLRSFELGHYEEDASFDNSILKECGSGTTGSGGYQPLVVTISITQHPSGYLFIPAQAYVRSSSSTHSLNTICETSSSAGGVGEATAGGFAWAQPLNGNNSNGLNGHTNGFNGLNGFNGGAVSPPPTSRSVHDLFTPASDQFLMNNRAAAFIGLSHLAAGEKPKLCRETLDLSKGLYRNHQDEFLRKKTQTPVSYLYSQI